MATSFEVEMTFGSSADEVFAMFCDPKYLELRCSETGGSDIEVSSVVDAEGGAVLTMKRSVPAEVPSFAKSFVGDTIEIDETHTWSPPTADGSREAAITCSFGGLPVGFSGKATLADSGDASADDRTTFHLEAAVKAAIPLMGGKIEGVVRDQTMRATGKENKVARGWLAK